MKNNTLSSELSLAKELGFSATSKNSIAKNPYLLLADGSCLLWVAGKLLALVTTEEHFGRGLHRKQWKPSNGNKPESTLTTTEINSNGIGRHTEIYYRESFKETIRQIARDFKLLEADVVMDHINHMRGDCRRENLRPATRAQNNQNRSCVKVARAFYTLEDLAEKTASGEWTILR